MQITLKWLNEEGACEAGKNWFLSQKKTDSFQVIDALIKGNRFGWANWTIVRFMTHKQKVQFAVFAAEQVIKIYERAYPNDKRPRQAIEAAKRWIEDPSDLNRDAAANAAYTAANAANAAAYTAANAAYTAANAAYTAANAAAYAAANAANAAYAAANAAERKTMQTRILKFGLKLLKPVTKRKKQLVRPV